MKKPLILIANWKMNLFVQDAVDLATALNTQAGRLLQPLPRLLLAPDFLAIHPVKQSLGKNSFFEVVAQNIAYQPLGAYTGQINIDMIKVLGLRGALIGHSEVRGFLNETTTMIHLKLKRLVEKELMPILCIGETAIEREKNQLEGLLARQVDAALLDIALGEHPSIMLAYEPRWAIGSGKTPSIQEIEFAHGYIREALTKKYGKVIGKSIPILYGGSLNSKNAKAIFAVENVQGGLVGGAALKLEEFFKLIKIAAMQ